jgi:hypothetical protein
MIAIWLISLDSNEFIRDIGVLDINLKHNMLTKKSILSIIEKFNQNPRPEISLVTTESNGSTIVVCKRDSNEEIDFDDLNLSIEEKINKFQSNVVIRIHCSHNQDQDKISNLDLDDEKFDINVIDIIPNSVDDIEMNDTNNPIYPRNEILLEGSLQSYVVDSYV